MFSHSKAFLFALSLDFFFVFFFFWSLSRFPDKRQLLQPKLIQINTNFCLISEIPYALILKSLSLFYILKSQVYYIKDAKRS